MVDESGHDVLLMAEQKRFGYEAHAFSNRAHFETWAKAHPTTGLVPMGSARGRLISRRPIDHRFDYETEGEVA